MKTELMLAAVAVALLPLAGCGGKNEPPDLAKSQRQAIEKAKSVEQTLQQSAGRQREEADKSEK
jgi:predicted small lipoprotein YifL